MKNALIKSSLLMFMTASASAWAQVSLENVPATEAADIETISQLIVKQFADEHAAHPDQIVPRDAHPKAHGCVKAEFTVLGGLPPALANGLFAQPASYKTWIRFSNGLPPTAKPDWVPDGRGMAVKVIGVKGPKLLPNDEKETQDFLMINFPAFFVRNVSDYVQFTTNKAAFLATHLHEAAVASEIGLQIVKNPFHTAYWTMSPYLMGADSNQAVKFRAKPVGCDGGSVPSDPFFVFGGSILRQAMIRSMDQGDECFEFQAQPQLAPVSTPIEDPTISWDDAGAPFTTVAKIRVPKVLNAGRLGDANAARTQFCEDISLTPWHGLVDHRPLGGINRARRTIYNAVSEFRHQMNGTQRIEPTGDENL